MITNYILPLDDPKATLDTVGGKGASLSRLANAGFPVPGGYHVTTDAYRQFITQNELQPKILAALTSVDISDTESLEIASSTINRLFKNSPIPLDIAEAVVLAYSELPGETPAVAVRSSATAEDLPEASFAGQQETYLNVYGPEALLDATRNCWASLWTARAIGYRGRQGIHPNDIALAVVVQLLITSEAAGIMFTANPLSGARYQVLINASWGLGEAVVGGLVTPDTLTLEKSSGSVIKRETADKLVQTVRSTSTTEEIPVPENLRSIPVLSDEQAAELAQFGKQIEALYEIPMDIEWALADNKFSIVQARPITALPEPEPPAPTEWKLPQGAYAAMRNNIVELMTDPLSPLFRTFGLSAVNSSMNAMLTSFLGSADVMPDDLIISVNEYAYYNGSVRFGPMMKIILDTRGILKRMFTGAVERWTEQGRPHYIDLVEKWQTSQWAELSSIELFDAARQLSTAAIDAYGALVSGVIPAAWISEALFTYAYKLVKQRNDPPAPTYLMGFDSLPIRAEKALYDLSKWVCKHGVLDKYLSETPASQIADQLEDEQPAVKMVGSIWLEWHQRFQAHLEEFGHTIYNLDFANPVPADDPTPMLEALKFFISGNGINPYIRQQAAAERREAAVQSIRSRLGGWRLNLFNKNLERAQRYAPLREDGLADVGLSYPLLRQMLRELGKRFLRAGVIEQPDDIFWLEQEEVEIAVTRLDNGEALENLSDLIPRRKAVWNVAKRTSPPMMLPQIKFFGVDLGELKSGGSRKGQGDSLKGVAASPGSVTAPACVMHGPGDFSKMNTGDVLVASLTTPAWTPLFARASAIVTDIGGPLSHGSIVAREYGIPAVLGTGGATARITSGQMITVDGSSGIVTISKNGDQEE